MSEFASEGSQAADEEYDHVHAHPVDEPYAAASAGGQPTDDQGTSDPAEEREGDTPR
jgi:hypothetical protein